MSFRVNHWYLDRPFLDTCQRHSIHYLHQMLQQTPAVLVFEISNLLVYNMPARLS
jgi:hypothetical protein